MGAGCGRLPSDALRSPQGRSRCNGCRAARTARADSSSVGWYPSRLHRASVSKYSSRGAPGTNRISIDASPPDSFRKPWMPPGGTCRKSPKVASKVRAPSVTRTTPDRTKNDSDMVRWKWGPAPDGSGPMSHRYRPKSPPVDAPVARYRTEPVRLIRSGPWSEARKTAVTSPPCPTYRGGGAGSRRSRRQAQGPYAGISEQSRRQARVQRRGELGVGGPRGLSA